MSGPNALIMEVEEALHMWGTPLIKALFLSVVALLALGSAWGVKGQGLATFRVEENIRAEAGGVVLGRVLPGVTLPVLSRDDRWVQVQLEGWIWTRSIQVTDRLGFDLVVSVAPRENLRAEPSGEVLATLVNGTLLDRVEDVPGWTRIGRAAWVWAESVDLDEAPASSGSTQPLAVPQFPSEERWWQGGSGGAPVLSGPDGDTLAMARPGTELRILAREGNWIRVRLEGWSWAPEVQEGYPLASESAVELTPTEAAQNPQLHRGKTVTWELQFVSLERAEMIRTDFYEGEPFLLTRTGSSESIFVYVAIPPDRLGEVEGLIPLERIRVVGRLRTGAAALTGNPILDLLELTRLSRN